MAIKLRTWGDANDDDRRIIGKATFNDVEPPLRKQHIRIVRESASSDSLDGYAAVLFEKQPSVTITTPFIQNLGNLDFIELNSIVAVEPSSGSLRVLYRPKSSHNVLFATDACNSHCLMCSQPSLPADNEKMAKELLRIIDLIPNQPEHIGISGGEPSLLKDGLIRILTKLREKLPQTAVTMLSNARLFAYEDFTKKIAEVCHSDFLISIPLYSNNAVTHDYIVQAKGAFDQTIQGLYNCARYGLNVEIRVVLHKQTIPELLNLANFIYRNIPFVSSVVLMGMEHMGYVRKNWELLWVDPIDYADLLEKTVQRLHYYRINTSLYNLPLCVLPKSLWNYARRSISDFKNIYLKQCDRCSQKNNCCGLFQSSETCHSIGIKAI